MFQITFLEKASASTVPADDVIIRANALIFRNWTIFLLPDRLKYCHTYRNKLIQDKPEGICWLTAKFPYLFIITYGRSGSTLLQGILNAIPGYCIRGENNGVLIPLRRMHNILLTAKKKYEAISQTPADAWYGISDVNEKKLRDDIRNLVTDNIIRPPDNSRCIGFKEIRYASQMVGDLSEFLAFIKSIFPGAGFIFNARALEQTAKSDWWPKRKDAAQYLSEFRAAMEAAYGAHKICSFWIDYEVYTANPESLAALFEFLGEEFDVQMVTDVLSKRHSASPREVSKIQ